MLKTIEMLIKLAENPKKIFIRPRDGRRFRTSSKIRDGEIIDYYVSDLTPLTSSECISLNDEWEEVPQEVPWQEAIQAWVDGKKVYFIDVNNKKRIIRNCNLFIDDGVYVHREHLTEGKWYIE